MTPRKCPAGRAGRPRWVTAREAAVVDTTPDVPWLCHAAVNRDWQQSGKSREVYVARQNGEVSPFSDRADEKIGAGSLEPLRPARIEVLGGALEVGRLEWFVRKRPQVIAEPFERARRRNTAKELLPNHAEHRYAAFINQRPQLVDRGVCLGPPTTKRERPYGGVDQHLHRRRRCFL